MHRLVSGRASQQTVQRALHVLVQLGIVTSTKAGSAYLYVLNEDHIAVEPLRQLASPLELLRRFIADTLDSRDAVTAVVVFGSVARGDSTHTSDVDLLVLADSSWDRRADVKNAVETRFGSTCDVLQYTPEEYLQWAESGDEPVLRTIAREGIALWGNVPRVSRSSHINATG